MILRPSIKLLYTNWASSEKAGDPWYILLVTLGLIAVSVSGMSLPSTRICSDEQIFQYFLSREVDVGDLSGPNIILILVMSESRPLSITYYRITLCRVLC